MSLPLTAISISLILLFTSANTSADTKYRKWALSYDEGFILSEETRGSNCWISVKGDITEDLAEKFIRNFNYLQKEAKCEPQWLYLESRGGNIDAAMRMGNFIRKNDRVHTVVPSGSYCYSACGLIFISSKVRWLSEKNESSLGLHSTKTNRCLFDVSREEKQYINRMLDKKAAQYYLERVKDGCSSMNKIHNSTALWFGISNQLVPL